jgi:rare lipoprotein A (peptidoglycan hydrolase)
MPGLPAAAGPAAAGPTAAGPTAAGPAAAGPTAARSVAPDTTDLTRLQARLEAAATAAEQLAEALERAAARDGGLRVELGRLAEQRDAARRGVDVRARQAFLATSGAGQGPLAELVVGLAAPDLRVLAEAELARRGSGAAVRAALALAAAVDEHSAAARVLRDQAAAYRTGLLQQAQQALAAQEAARRLLAEAETAVAVEQSRARDAELAGAAAQRTAELVSARAAAAAQRTAELVAADAAVQSTRTRLDDVSASVTQALTPAQTRRGRTAAEQEAPVLALVEAAGPGYPAGYGPTGTVLRGLASWYGPGFVGSPTASGTPYDPERLTCAHKSLPLGTVVRVTRDDRTVSCLVNDRGPYVGDRILDLSRAGSRALGYDGVAAVVVEVLAPVG